MADQKVERDLPAELQIFFHPSGCSKSILIGKSCFLPSILAKNLPSSEIRNFASFAWIFPGLKTWKFLTLGGATLSTEISATSGSQKFLNLQNFFKIFFWKVDFSRFRRSIFSTKGVRGVRNFFLTWSLSTRTKTPWQTKKSNETSPRRYKCIFIPQGTQNPIFKENHVFFLPNSPFFPIYLIPQLPEVTSDHPGIKFLTTRDMDGCDPGSRNFCQLLK